MAAGDDDARVDAASKMVLVADKEVISRFLCSISNMVLRWQPIHSSEVAQPVHMPKKVFDSRINGRLEHAQ